MRLGIYTNMDERCGNAEYARDLARAMAPYYPVYLAPRVEQLTMCDVILINWHPAKVDVNKSIIWYLQSQKKKVILILQNSFDWPVVLAAEDILRVPDKVVAHEPMQLDIPVEYIPLGVPVIKDLPPVAEQLTIGVAGFPFPWKRFDVTAKVAKHFGARCRIFAPSYPYYNTVPYMSEVTSILGGLADVQRGWAETADVVKGLAECTFNVFWFQSQGQDDTLGQTGSARLGVAAGRPMIISTHRKFRTLLTYKDDFYVANSVEEVFAYAQEILADTAAARRPVRAFADMRYDEVAKMYKRVIEETLA
jgi:hypothetical protein